MGIRPFFMLTVVLLFLPALLWGGEKTVIGHRGAPGYLLENNIPSLVLAVAQGADAIQQDVVMTKDNRLVVYRDLFLDTGTNVKELFPDRERQDGHAYVIDFTLDEIQLLFLTEPGESARFPMDTTNPGLRIPSLEEMLAVVRGLEKTLEKPINLFLEIKKPWFHRQEGRDISQSVLQTLARFHYGGENSLLSLQSFDHEELKRIHDQLLPAMSLHLNLIQMIDHNNGQETMIDVGGSKRGYQYDWMFSKFGLKALSLCVNGIGLDQSMLVDEMGVDLQSSFLENGRTLGLKIYVYTLAADALPPYAESFDTLLEHFLVQLGVDGVYTDHCDRVVQYLRNRSVFQDTSTPPTTEQTPEGEGSPLINPLEGPLMPITLSPAVSAGPIQIHPLPEEAHGHSDQ